MSIADYIRKLDDYCSACGADTSIKECDKNCPHLPNQTNSKSDMRSECQRGE